MGWNNLKRNRLEGVDIWGSASEMSVKHKHRMYLVEKIRNISKTFIPVPSKQTVIVH